MSKSSQKEKRSTSVCYQSSHREQKPQKFFNVNHVKWRGLRSSKMERQNKNCGNSRRNWSRGRDTRRTKVMQTETILEWRPRLHRTQRSADVKRWPMFNFLRSDIYWCDWIFYILIVLFIRFSYRQYIENGDVSLFSISTVYCIPSCLLCW